ncbi:Phage integrase family protein [Burkholderia orbicola]
MPYNPAADEGPELHHKAGKDAGARRDRSGQLLDSVDVRMSIGLRDCALIALMVFLFTQICAALTM